MASLIVWVRWAPGCQTAEKRGDSIGTVVKSLSKIKENRLLQGLSLTRVTGCFTARLCLLLHFQLSYLLLFLSQAAVHI